MAPGTFGVEYQAIVTDYLKSIDKYKHWDKFYKRCGYINSSKVSSSRPRRSNAADLSMTDLGRHALNFSSSPVRPGFDT